MMRLAMAETMLNLPVHFQSVVGVDSGRCAGKISRFVCVSNIKLPSRSHCGGSTSR